jgi:predicted nucleic acid-binding protein
LKNIVVDASVALAFCLEDESNEQATALLNSLDKYKIIVPSHWWVEVGNGLLMAVRRGRINIKERDEAMQLLIGLEPTILPISPSELIEEVFPIASYNKLTSYDACYLYLAVIKKAPLATLDKALRQAASKVGAEVFNE